MSWAKERNDAPTVISEIFSVIIENSQIQFYLLQQFSLTKCLLLLKVTVNLKFACQSDHLN
jgi:hypothetical protein